MVAIGSGGAITGDRYILDRLPAAQGYQYEQQFYRRHKIDVISLFHGAPVGGGSTLI